MNGAQHKVVGAGFGIAGAYVVAKGMGDPYGWLIAPASMVGCMLPDMDHDRTGLGRKRKVVTKTFSYAFDVAVIGGTIAVCALAIALVLGFKDYGFSLTELGIAAVAFLAVWFTRKRIANSDSYRWATKHRGLMHTLVMPAVLYLSSCVSDFPLWRYTFLGLLIGYCSHLFADMLTIEGCPVLFPLSKKNIHFTSFRSKNKSCVYVSWIVALAAVAIAYLYVGGII